MRRARAVTRDGLSRGDRIELRGREGRLPRPGPRAPRGPGRVRARAASPATACACAWRRRRARATSGRRSRGDPLAPSPDRRPSPLPALPALRRLRVPGARLRRSSVALKEDILRESLRARAALGGRRSSRASPGGGLAHARHAPLSRSSGRHGLRLGLHEEGTPRVVDLERCLQLSPAMNEAARGLRAALQERPARTSAHVRDVELAESGRRREASSPPWRRTSRRRRRRRSGALADAAPGLTGLGGRAGSGPARRFLLLRGDPHVDATVRGLAPPRARPRRSSRATGSWSTTSCAAVRRPRAAERPRARPLRRRRACSRCPWRRARRGRRAVEPNPAAVEDARANMEAGRPLERAGAAADVDEALRRRRPRPEERIVLDPPRTGAGPQWSTSSPRGGRGRDRVRLLRSADPGPRPRRLREAGLSPRSRPRLRPLSRHVPPRDGRAPRRGLGGSGRAGTFWVDTARLTVHVTLGRMASAETRGRGRDATRDERSSAAMAVQCVVR